MPCIDIFHDNGLENVVKRATHDLGSTLDLMVTNNPRELGQDQGCAERYTPRDPGESKNGFIHRFHLGPLQGQVM